MQYIVWSFVAAGLILFTLFKQRTCHKRPLPPGPQPWPVIGNTFDMPREKEWLTFTEWGKTHGDIISLSLLGGTCIILNSFKAASDLLDKRSSLYSDRPRLPMSDMVGYDNVVTLTPCGARFNKMRRLLHQVLSPKASQEFWHTQEYATARFLGRLLQSPEHFADHIRYMTGEVILKVSHGYTVSAAQDPLVELAGQTMKEFSLAGAPGGLLINLLPWLKHVPEWLPGTEFKAKAVEWRKNLLKMADMAHEFTMNEMKKGRALPSFTAKNMEHSHTPENELLVKWSALAIYGGGADTTVSALNTFFLAMCTHPHIQTAAQGEIDALLGGERLPTMADRPSLPYIDAILKEILRWGPVVPGAVPHRLTREDEYKGYRIPEGAIIWANVWGMLHDPEFFPEPSQFRPDRFMSKDNVGSPSSDPLEIAFGFGRRICPGQNLAVASLYLGIAMTLATFTISPALDSSGKTIHPDIDWTLQIISHPKPFRCDIKPRNARAIELVHEAIHEGGFK